MIVGDGPERAGARAARRRARRRDASSSAAALRARRGAAPPRARPACSCCRASTRRSASPTSRRWPRGVPAIGTRGEPGPEEIAASRRRDAARPARRPGGAGRASSRALLERRGLAARARRRGARERRGELHVGGAAAARPSPPTRRRCDETPVLFVTNHAPPFRVGAFAALHEREDVVFALIGGDVRHGGGGTGDGDLPFPVDPPAASATIARLAASGRYRAVIAGLSGRVALPAAYAGARAGARPVRAVGDDLAPPAHARARALLPAAAPHLPPRRRDRHLRPARHAPTCAPRARRSAVFEAPQSVDTAFWSAPAHARSARATFQVLFAGRLEREKGVAVLLEAWRASGLPAPTLRCSGRRRPDPSPGRRRRRDRARAARTRRTAQPLRGQRRCGRTVGPHARLPRAVGARRQRSLPPGSPRDRHRRRRSRRRRARAARAHRPRRPGGRRDRARRRAAPPARRPRAARPARRQRPRGGRAPTRTTRGPTACPRARSREAGC